MATIITKQEQERGCGFRRGGGIYLVNDGPGRACGRMPLPLHVCPTCSQGIKPSRGFQWIQSKPLLEAAPACKHRIETRNDILVDVVTADGTDTMRIPGPLNIIPGPECTNCPMSGEAEKRVGLMFVGGKFYATPDKFIDEARRMGLSKRIAQIPKELVVGETWVWLAHRETIPAVHAETCATSRMESDYEFRVKMMEEGMIGVLCDCDAQPTPGVFHAFVPTRIEYILKGTETGEELDALEKRGLTIVKVERIGENGELFPDLSTSPEAEDDSGN